MLHLHDRATMARALTLDLDPKLHALLAERIGAFSKADYDLTDYTEFLIVQAGDTEAAIHNRIGFSPLVEPIDGVRFGHRGFHPFWDWLTDHGGWFEMIVTFGSSFAYVLFIQDADEVLPDLLALCRVYA